MREIRLALLEADVNYKVVKDFIKKTTGRCVGTDVLESLTPAQMIVKIVNEELTALMGSENQKLKIASQPPTVVMLVGLQGRQDHQRRQARRAFKTEQNPLLAACDIYRPAAIKQLQVVGEQLGIPVFEMGDEPGRYRQGRRCPPSGTATTWSSSIRPAACMSMRPSWTSSRPSKRPSSPTRSCSSSTP
ncbi:MAG: signal recognition particle receptor subunit alpha [Oscillospiraceae bacterium]